MKNGTYRLKWCRERRPPLFLGGRNTWKSETSAVGGELRARPPSGTLPADTFSDAPLERSTISFVGRGSVDVGDAPSRGLRAPRKSFRFRKLDAEGSEPLLRKPSDYVIH